MKIKNSLSTIIDILKDGINDIRFLKEEEQALVFVSKGCFYHIEIINLYNPEGFFQLSVRDSSNFCNGSFMARLENTQELELGLAPFINYKNSVGSFIITHTSLNSEYIFTNFEVNNIKRESNSIEFDFKYNSGNYLAALKRSETVFYDNYHNRIKTYNDLLIKVGLENIKESLVSRDHMILGQHLNVPNLD